MSVTPTITTTVSYPVPYTLGAELLTNADISSDTGWAKGAGWLYFNEAYLTLGGAAGALSQTVTTVDGDEYRIDVDVGATDAPGISVSFGGSAIFTDLTSQGVFSIIVTASGTSNALEFNDDTAVVSVRAASIKKVTR